MKRMILLLISIGLVFAVMAPINQPQASASLFAPKVKTTCEWLDNGAFICTIALDTEATKGLNALVKAYHYDAEHLINKVCIDYGSQIASELPRTIKFDLIMDYGITLFQWYLNCWGTLGSIQPPAIGLISLVDVAAAYSACVAVIVDVTGFIDEYLRKTLVFPPLQWWQVAIVQTVALQRHSIYTAISKHDNRCPLR